VDDIQQITASCYKIEGEANGSMSTAQISRDEWKDPTGLHNESIGRQWWWHMAAQNKTLPPMDEQVQDIVDEIAVSLGEDEGRLVLCGGNMKCTSPGDSVRLVLMLAQAMDWPSPHKKNMRYFTGSNGQRVYMALFPFIWESPQHENHPVYGAVFSTKPLHWEEIK
jgi:hypothetical protein